MGFHFHRLILFIGIFSITNGSAWAQAVIEPPFGQKWGDSPEKLITWASQHSLDVTISLPGDQPTMRILKIAARKGTLPQTQANSIECRFLVGKLYELAVHYSDPEASADLMEARFEAIRKQVTLEHGALMKNQQQRTVENQFVTRTQSFHREPVKGLFLLLAFTEVEDLLRKTKDAKYSLVYRNENFRKELIEALKIP
jgi:hypothetical protein